MDNQIDNLIQGRDHNEIADILKNYGLSDLQELLHKAIEHKRPFGWLISLITSEIGSKAQWLSASKWITEKSAGNKKVV